MQHAAHVHVAFVDAKNKMPRTRRPRFEHGADKNLERIDKLRRHIAR
jgi:hypothetical protein